MAITFEPADTWRGRGRPPVDIPEEIAKALETTYRTGKVATDEADESSAETRQVIALMRLYCSRQGRKLDYQFYDDPDTGRTYLRFRMRDTRTYTPQIVTGRNRRR
jgi:DNA-binding protein H-NS